MFYAVIYLCPIGYNCYFIDAIVQTAIVTDDKI